MFLFESDKAQDHGVSGASDVPIYRPLAFLAFLLLILTFVDGLIPQLQILVFGGRVLVTNSILNILVLITMIVGSLIHPKISFSKLPVFMWLICIGYLLIDAPYLMFVHEMSLKDILASYNGYYFLLLSGPAALAFQGAVPERTIIRCTELLLLICAIVGIAQYLSAQPILSTESIDGKFQVASWQFFDHVRSFSFFTSGLVFGLFCSLCGALGVALFRTSRLNGMLLFAVSALACFSTLTRLCYLVFICATLYACVLVYGKKPTRGVWLPLLFFALGILTILTGLGSLASADAGDLQDSGSLLLRLNEGTYYLDMISHSTLASKLFGSGLTFSAQKNPVPIDNVLLAVVLHTGLVGLILFGVLLTKMWLYLRKEAVRTRRPFIVAAASLWATLPCAGIFNVVMMQLGAVFVICILSKDDLCGKRQPAHAGGTESLTSSGNLT